VAIDSFFKKLSFSAYFGSLKLFLSNDVTDKSRVLFHRNIRERVNMVMPFLMYDSDPYMVISDDGRLFWIYDAYTVSSKFPYSQPIGNGINYIRNSVKVTVNAFDGSMKFYIADREDPIVRTIDKIFPGTLLPLQKCPLILGNISGILWISSVSRPWFIQHITWKNHRCFTTRKTSGRYLPWEQAPRQRSWNPITRS
jgi:uncharacterized membrane protein (UPF0182 family)